MTLVLSLTLSGGLAGVNKFVLIFFALLLKTVCAIALSTRYQCESTIA